jgi:Tol biopolymer transport system component
VESWDVLKVAFDDASGTTEGEPTPAIQSSRRLSWPDVSPDGEWLAYTSNDPEDIFIIRTNGTNGRQLTDDPYLDRQPRWSPDGNEIAFYSNRSGKFEIWTIHHDGSELQQLTETPDRAFGNPKWSPDGGRMSYLDYTGRTSYIFDPNRAWEEQTPLALPPLSDEGEWFYAWSWSPDGQWIAGVVRSGPVLLDEIVIYSLESKQYKRLTHIGRFPIWLPDSRRMLFLTPSEEIKLLDIESGKSQEILSLFPDILRRPAISADGQSLYFERRSSEADIWMLTLKEEK